MIKYKNKNGNFRGKYQGQNCFACNAEKETTEHVMCCDEYKRIVGHTMEIREGCFQNIEWLAQAVKVYERIEETREVLSKCI